VRAPAPARFAGVPRGVRATFVAHLGHPANSVHHQTARVLCSARRGAAGDRAAPDQVDPDMVPRWSAPACVWHAQPTSTTDRMSTTPSTSARLIASWLLTVEHLLGDQADPEPPQARVPCTRSAPWAPRDPTRTRPCFTCQCPWLSVIRTWGPAGCEVDCSVYRSCTPRSGGSAGSYSPGLPTAWMPSHGLPNMAHTLRS
jgi:hypothetical protein